jgi:hypothetical protein
LIYSSLNAARSEAVHRQQRWFST